MGVTLSKFNLWTALSSVNRAYVIKVNYNMLPFLQLCNQRVKQILERLILSRTICIHGYRLRDQQARLVAWCCLDKMVQITKKEVSFVYGNKVTRERKVPLAKCRTVTPLERMDVVTLERIPLFIVLLSLDYDLILKFYSW